MNTIGAPGCPISTASSGQRSPTAPTTRCAAWRRKSGAPSTTRAAVGNPWPAFRTLRRLVLNWYEDWAASGNPWAYQLMRRVYVWLASPSSLLYDPALATVEDLGYNFFLTPASIGKRRDESSLQQLKDAVLRADQSWPAVCSAAWSR